MIRPLPTGDSSFASISMVSVSQAWGLRVKEGWIGGYLSSKERRMSRAFWALAFVFAIVTPGMSKEFRATFWKPLNFS
jgi:hypothetical protein